MVKKISIAVVAFVLAFYFVVPIMAQDMPAKAEKKAMVKQTGPVKQVSCDDACGFVVQSRNEKELIAITKQHVKTYHKMNLTDAQVKAKITDVPGK
jgi:predicted small metal-binding protein